MNRHERTSSGAETVVNNNLRDRSASAAWRLAGLGILGLATFVGLNIAGAALAVPAAVTSAIYLGARIAKWIGIGALVGAGIAGLTSAAASVA